MLKHFGRFSQGMIPETQKEAVSFAEEVYCLCDAALATLDELSRYLPEEADTFEKVQGLLTAIGLAIESAEKVGEGLYEFLSNEESAGDV